jgi:hypothetical protein
MHNYGLSSWWWTYLRAALSDKQGAVLGEIWDELRVLEADLESHYAQLWASARLNMRIWLRAISGTSLRHIMNVSNFQCNRL